MCYLEYKLSVTVGFSRLVICIIFGKRILRALMLAEFGFMATALALYRLGNSISDRLAQVIIWGFAMTAYLLAYVLLIYFNKELQ
jgi:hypothetical protein